MSLVLNGTRSVPLHKDYPGVKSAYRTATQLLSHRGGSTTKTGLYGEGPPRNTQQLDLESTARLVVFCRRRCYLDIKNCKTSPV